MTKEKITLYLDEEVIANFQNQANLGDGKYQTLINDALVRLINTKNLKEHAKILYDNLKKLKKDRLFKFHQYLAELDGTHQYLTELDGAIQSIKLSTYDMTDIITIIHYLNPKINFDVTALDEDFIKRDEFIKTAIKLQLINLIGCLIVNEVNERFHIPAFIDTGSALAAALNFFSMSLDELRNMVNSISIVIDQEDIETEFYKWREDIPSEEILANNIAEQYRDDEISVPSFTLFAKKIQTLQQIHSLKEQNKDIPYKLYEDFITCLYSIVTEHSINYDGFKFDEVVIDVSTFKVMLSDMIKIALASENIKLLKVIRENGFIWDPKELEIETTQTPILTINESGSFIFIEDQESDEGFCNYDKLFAEHFKEIVNKELLPTDCLISFKESLLMLDD
jgi:hypothetical protein